MPTQVFTPRPTHQPQRQQPQHAPFNSSPPYFARQSNRSPPPASIPSPRKIISTPRKNSSNNPTTPLTSTKNTFKNVSVPTPKTATYTKIVTIKNHTFRINNFLLSCYIFKNLQN